MGAPYEGACKQAREQIKGPSIEPVQHQRRASLGMQRVETCPYEQVEQQEQHDLIEGACELLRHPMPQQQQDETARQIVTQSRAQSQGFARARVQLRILRSRSMSFS